MKAIGAVFAGLLIVLIIIKAFAPDLKSKNESNPVVTTGAALMDDPTKKEENRYDSGAVKKLLPKFKIEKDEFDGYELMRHKTSTKYVNYNSVHFLIEKSSTPTLFLRVQYSADDWLFIKNVQFLIDSTVHQLYFTKFDRDNGDGAIWEWTTSTYSGNKELFNALAKAKSVKIKFSGSQYSKTRVLDPKQIAALKETFEMYKAMGGETKI